MESMKGETNEYLAMPDEEEPEEIGLSDDFNNRLSTIEDALISFGLLKNEIKVYLHLAEAGTKKAKDISEAIKIQRTETYRLLRYLEKKGLVFAIIEKPVKFTAVSLDKAIDLLVEAQRIRIQTLQNQKASLVGLWMSIPQQKEELVKRELFQKIEGEQRIIFKANEMLEKTERKFEIFAPDQYIAELYYGGFFDNLRKYAEKLEVTLLTGSSCRSTYFVDQIKWPRDKHRTVETQNLPCFIISDKKEALIVFQEGDRSNEFGHKKKTKSVAVWTNFHALVWPLEALFSKLTVLDLGSAKSVVVELQTRRKEINCLSRN
jgi:HTH-type transcriptional regulator, sugar sensing transcriptional regulator